MCINAFCAYKINYSLCKLLKILPGGLPASRYTDYLTRGIILPMAVNTWLDVTLPDEQAEPELTANPAKSKP